MEAAIDYLEELGNGSTDAAMRLIADYERSLSCAMLDALESVPGVAVHGLVERRRIGERVPTFSFTVDGVRSSKIAEGLAARDIGVRSGHMYSPRLIERLGLMPGGVVRASLAHYNTVDEVERFRAALIDVIDESRRS
jgi:selenocysteine lyase/cysteine desulfurase